MKHWTIEYTNDVGPNDESFYEWWEVTNGTKAFKCNTEEDAKWLLNTIDLNKELLEALKSTKALNLHLYEKGTVGNRVYKQIETAIKKAQS